MSYREVQDLDQSLYSRLVIGGDNKYDPSFFNSCAGQYDRNGELVERVDTNMYTPGQISHSQIYMIKGIRFKETLMNKNVREHLLKYAYFYLKIVDRDYLEYPLHLMDNYYYFLEKKIAVPIILNAYQNFQVILRMKEYPRRFQLTCELLGIMRRPT